MPPLSIHRRSLPRLVKWNIKMCKRYQSTNGRRATRGNDKNVLIRPHKYNPASYRLIARQVCHVTWTDVAIPKDVAARRFTSEYSKLVK